MFVIQQCIFEGNFRLPISREGLMTNNPTKTKAEASAKKEIGTIQNQIEFNPDFAQVR